MNAFESMDAVMIPLTALGPSCSPYLPLLAPYSRNFQVVVKSESIARFGSKRTVEDHLLISVLIAFKTRTGLQARLDERESGVISLTAFGSLLLCKRAVVTSGIC